MGFIEYLASKRYSPSYRDDLLNYLDRYATIISEPSDIIRMFSKLESGQRHLWLGLRVLFNYLEALSWDADFLNALRKALPKFYCGIDLKVPEESGILQSLTKLSKAPKRYAVLYNLLLDSGLRLIEGIKINNGFKEFERINGFCRIALGEFRGSKQAYYAYFAEATYDNLPALNGEIMKPRTASHYFRKYGFISPKYLRKFAFDKMISLDIPESVADFIEGRVPKRIGAKHYMVLRRQADNFYSRYAEYLAQLRAKI
jgi:intergrase/recombinase